MKRVPLLLLFLLGLSSSALANQRVQGFCEKGGQAVVTAGTQSTTLVQRSFPSCTVTVYLNLTLTPATIYSDNSNTPLSNPFTADSSGRWFFYAVNGRYDVTISGGGLSSPFTFADILLQDNTSGIFPSGTQLQYLRVQPNTGNNTTNQFASVFPISTADYQWPAQTCNVSNVCSVGGSSGSTLSPGNNTLTLTPFPLGMNGSDTAHHIWVSGGTGTAEACLINGGSGTSGSASGSVQINCANSHSGAFTVQTATGGIQEALQTLFTSGGVALIPPSNPVIHASIRVPSNVILSGSGRGATNLIISANDFTNTVPWRLYGFNPSGVVIGALVGGTKVTIQGLTISFSTSQSAPPNGSYGIELINVTYARIYDTEVLNGPILTSGNTFLPYGLNGTTANSIADSNWVFNQVCTVSGEGAGGFQVGGTGNRIIHNYASNGCNGMYVSGGIDTVFEDNVFELAGSTQVAGSQAFASDNGVGVRFVANRCIGNNTGPNCYSVTTDLSSPPATATTFIGNMGTNCGQGYQVKVASALIATVDISGGSVATCVTPFITINAGSSDISVRGVGGITTGHAESVGYASCSGLAALVNGANQNIAIGNFAILRTSCASGPTSAFSIGGIAGGTIDGRELTIHNNSGQTMTINNQDAGSSAANRIVTGTGGNLVVTHAIVSLFYSIADLLWYVKSTN